MGYSFFFPQNFINSFSIQMSANETVIDHLFISQLFQHPTFQQNLQNTLDSLSFFAPSKADPHLVRIADDLSSLIFEQASSVLQRSCLIMKAEIRALRQDIDKMKDWHFSQLSKTEESTKEISEDINFEDQQLFDLPSIKRTIHSLQSRVKEISLNSSAILDSSQPLRDSRKEDAIQERIGREIGKLEENLAIQQEHLEELVNKRMDKQQKTINNILETLNELHNPTIKNESKAVNMLSSSKSAVKLKTFFGFG